MVFYFTDHGYTGIYSSPAIGSNGTTYFGAEDVRLYALTPTDGTTNWIYIAEGRTTTT